MIEGEELEAWLEAHNREYRRRDIPPKQRLLEALRDLLNEKGIAVPFGDPIAQSISAWFESHTQAGSMAVGPTIEGAYRFDGVFWPLQMHFVIGTVRIKPKDSLVGMPPEMLDDLFRDHQSRDAYLNYWLDCADIRFMSERSSRQDGIGHRFLVSACEEFRAGAKLLVDRFDFWRSIQHSRMAVEMSCKAALAAQQGWSEKDVAKLKHRLDRAIQELGDFFAPDQQSRFLSYIEEFPEIGNRYEPNQHDQNTAWRAHQVALRILAEILRRLVPRESIRLQSGLPEAINFAL